MAKKNSGVKAAPVDDYPERPYDEAKADEKTIEKAENRATVDQIPDYHKDNPTLDTSGPEHDPEVQADIQEKVAEDVEAPKQD